jgi:N-acetylglutamate synthase-like GNAT family acetyltransferase
MQGFLQIRPATIKDFGLLGELERRAAKRFLGVPEATGMSPEQLEETLSTEELERSLSENGLWIAEWEGEPVDFLATHQYGDSLYIREVDVLQKYGRRGIGKALIGRALEYARRLGLSSLFLRTFRDVEWNSPFYEKIGFRAVEEHDWSEAT